LRLKLTCHIIFLSFGPAISSMFTHLLVSFVLGLRSRLKSSSNDFLINWEHFSRIYNNYLSSLSYWKFANRIRINFSFAFQSNYYQMISFIAIIVTWWLLNIIFNTTTIWSLYILFLYIDIISMICTIYTIANFNLVKYLILCTFSPFKSWNNRSILRITEIEENLLSKLYHFLMYTLINYLAINYNIYYFI